MKQPPGGLVSALGRLQLDPKDLGRQCPQAKK